MRVDHGEDSVENGLREDPRDSSAFVEDGVGVIGGRGRVLKRDGRALAGPWAPASSAAAVGDDAIPHAASVMTSPQWTSR